MAKNIIVGCASTTLSTHEIDLFKELQPWGLILFARNINNPIQLQTLILQFKEALGRPNAMVFIDQEGGRVSRLPKSHWRVPPSPTKFAQMLYIDNERAKRACLLNAMLTAFELKSLGVNANCAPMLDIPQKNADKIVAERALGNTPQQVIDLGRQITTGLKRLGVAPVIKHMPGHGRATSDSHLTLPKVDASLSELNDWDFVPFKALSEESMAMTAHIVFTRIDNKSAATVSSTIVNKVMRDTIGFDGLIMTDDINMQALTGSIATRAQSALDAGCDIVLHCSGKLEEMESLLPIATELSEKTAARASYAEKIAFKAMPDIDVAAIEDELTEMLKSY